MAVSWQFQQSGNWRLIYSNQVSGNERDWRSRIPILDPIDIPVSIEGRAIVMGAAYLQAPITWNVAGHLYQVVSTSLSDAPVFPGLGGTGNALDTGRRRVLLNTMGLHIFPRFASEHFYRFEPMPWIPRLNLSIWEYVGAETDSTEELLDVIRVDLARIEQKVS